MAKTKTKPELVSDDTIGILEGTWPHDVKVRCDHAGVEIREGHEPDVADTAAPDGQHLVRDRYGKKCVRFGKVEKVTLNDVDDPARACPDCGFSRSLVAIA
jgi:hypothetical protein